MQEHIWSFLRLFPSEADGCVEKLFLLDVITPLICFFRERRPRKTQNPPQQLACEIPKSRLRCLFET